MPEPLVAFIDTNVLLHYPPLAHVDWCEVCDTDAVTIMLCMPVINELDKYKADPRLGDRAQKRIKEITQHLNKEVRTGVRVEVYNAPIRRSDFPDTLSIDSFDDRITHFAVMYGQRVGGAVAVITGDLGLQLRCSAHDVRTISPPQGQRLPGSQTEEQKRIRELELELLEIRNRQPALMVSLVPDRGHKLKRPAQRPPAERLAELERKIKNRFYPPGHVGYLHSGHVQFLRDMDQWFQNDYRVADESARTIEVRVKLANTGAAPATKIDLSVQFPKSITAVFYDAMLSGDRAIPSRPPNPLHPELAQVASRAVPNNLFAVNSHMPLWGSVSDRKFLVSIQELPHDEVREFGPFFLTFGSWQDVQTFSVDVRVRTNTPPDLRKTTVPIMVELLGEDDGGAQ